LEVIKGDGMRLLEGWTENLISPSRVRLEGDTPRFIKLPFII